MQFDLERLGWKSFQDLGLAIAESRLGLVVEGFSSGRDAGRDGAALLRAVPTDLALGTATIQCKHTGNPTPVQLKHLRLEFSKIEQLVVDGLCDTYAFFTNRPMTAGVEASIRRKLTQLGVKHTWLIGRETIERLLTEDKNLRGLIPRVYGLGDLSEILDERIYAQTQSLLLHDEISRFVPTDPYFKTVNAIAQEGFALLLGEPASGKSAIMRAAALHAADRWSLEPMWLASLEELRTHWNPHRSDQLFLIDDAFGSTNFDPERAETWNRLVPVIRAAIDNGARLLLTSRDYVFAAARKTLKRDDLPVSRESEVVIEVEKLSLEERRQIVYNHLRLGNQPIEFKRAIKPHLARLTKSGRFLPETARRLGDRRFTSDLDVNDERSIIEFVEEPRRYLRGVIQTLSPRLQAALILLIANDGAIPSPVPSEMSTNELARRLDVTHHEIGRAMGELDGSLVRHVESDFQAEWQPRHPTVVDAINDWMLDDHELIDLYAHFASLASIARQATCGAVIKGAVQLPKQLWPVVFERMLATGGDDSSVRVRFFAYRCSSAAMRSSGRLQDIVALLRRRGFFSPLDSDPAARLLLRLSVDGLIPDDTQAGLLDSLTETAVNSFDPYCVTNPVVEQIVTSIGPERWLTFIERHTRRVCDELPTYVTTSTRNYISEVSREDLFAGVLTLMDHIAEWIADGSPCIGMLDQQRAIISEWVDAAPEPSHGRSMHEVLLRVIFGAPSESDMFSDVDEP